MWQRFVGAFLADVAGLVIAYLIIETTKEIRKNRKGRP